eukprot:1669480-Prymnesium_polylepis.1
MWASCEARGFRNRRREAAPSVADDPTHQAPSCPAGATRVPVGGARHPIAARGGGARCLVHNCRTWIRWPPLRRLLARGCFGGASL